MSTKGLMQNRPLRIIDILMFAAEAFPEQGLVSSREEGDIHRTTYPESLARASQLAHGLVEMGIRPGDRVATLAWNGYRHFELYYAISGLGAICHTVNPRLSREQMIYILNHAGDSALFIDQSLLPVVESISDDLPPGIKLVAMTDVGNVPASSLETDCYEKILAGNSRHFDWPEFAEETAAGLCYTSGTTGNPKGALYTHRSTVLHALMTIAGHQQCLKSGTAALPVVPLFHVNAWGMPYTAPIVGMSMVMPGRYLDGASLFSLMDAEKVYSAWGVPTVWAGLLKEIQNRGRPPEGFTDLVVGGSAAPRSMIEAFENMGISVNQAWGMTEMSPIGTRGQLPAPLRNAPLQERIDAKVGAGRRLFGVDFKLIGENGEELPHDGKAEGELFVRGNTIVSGYYNNDKATSAAFDGAGWFATGDIATLARDGHLIIRDRSKDMIKSGGEWISSIDIENTAISHPDIATCAVIAVPHPKWDERPILIAVPSSDNLPTLEDIHALLSAHFAKWQMPDDIVFMEDLPLTSTGKISKLTLRKKFADYVHPDFRNA